MLKMTRRPLVLCVEDEPLLLRDMCEELEEAGYQTIGVPDVAEAHVVLAKLTPALILCDINLPGQSGLDLLAELRETEAIPDVPFLLLTAQTDRAHMLKGKWAGADDYLTKPVDYDMLLATLSARLAQVDRMARTHQSQLQRQAVDLREHWYGVLDSLSQCAVVCNSDWSVRFANRAAQQLGEATPQDAPVVSNRAGDLSLHPALTQHSDVQNYGRGQAESAKIDWSPRAGGHAQWRITIQTLHERTPPMLTRPAHDDGFVVFLTDLGVPTAHSGQAMAQRFSLTPAESQVANLLIDGMTKQQMCTHLQVSGNTIAFHLRNMFGKTQTNRQAELVAVLLSSAKGAAPQRVAEKA